MPSSLFESRTRRTFSIRSTSRQRRPRSSKRRRPVRDEHEEHRPRLVVRKRLPHAGDLDRLEDAPAPPNDARPLDVRGRVRLDKLLADRAVEDVDEHVHVQIHRRRRVVAERLADEGGHVARPDLTERERAEEGAQPFDRAPVHRHRPRLPASSAFRLGEPGVDVLAEDQPFRPAVGLPLDADEPLAQFGLGLPPRPAVPLGPERLHDLPAISVEVLDAEATAALSVVLNDRGTARHCCPFRRYGPQAGGDGA